MELFQKELNIPCFMTIKNLLWDKTFLIGHGDGKGPEYDLQTNEKVFTNPFSKWLFRWLHPDIGVVWHNTCQ
jgi:UDP-2,3-diacylglucosamine hydrolase